MISQNIARNNHRYAKQLSRKRFNFTNCLISSDDEITNTKIDFCLINTKKKFTSFGRPYFFLCPECSICRFTAHFERSHKIRVASIPAEFRNDYIILHHRMYFVLNPIFLFVHHYPSNTDRKNSNFTNKLIKSIFTRELDRITC